MLSTPGELVHHVTHLGTTIESSQRDAVNAAVARAKVEHLRALDAVTAGRKLRGVGKNGAKLNVSYQTAQPGHPGAASASIKAVGPWQLIERDTKAHEITSRYANAGAKGRKLTRSHLVDLAGAGYSAGGRRAVLNIPGIGYRRYAHSRGTHGKHPWRIGRELAERVIPQEMTRISLAAIRKQFTG